MTIQKTLRELSDQIEELEYRAVEARVKRAAVYAKAMNEPDKAKRVNATRLADWAGVTRTAVIQAVQLNGPGTKNERDFAKRKAARARAARKAS